MKLRASPWLSCCSHKHVPVGPDLEWSRTWDLPGPFLVSCPSDSAGFVADLQSQGGYPSNARCRWKSQPSAKGYTFLELTVVMFLIGLTMVLTVPRFRHALFTDDLQATVRRLVGTVRTLRNEAVRERKRYALHVDMESNRLWVEWLGMSEKARLEEKEKAFELPTGVRIVDVWRKGKGKKVGGEAALGFTEKGYMEPSAIHLEAADGRQFTLIFSPFLARVEVVEKYVDFV